MLVLQNAVIMRTKYKSTFVLPACLTDAAAATSTAKPSSQVSEFSFSFVDQLSTTKLSTIVTLIEYEANKQNVLLKFSGIKVVRLSTSDISWYRTRQLK